jgi:hypothetical protein
MTPNDDTDPGTKALAYTGQLKTLNTNVVNFFLSDDRATSFAWEFNNGNLKPQRYNLFTTGYAYDATAVAGHRVFITFFTAFGRYLIDPHESMAFAVQSLTKTVGADGRTSGSIGSAVDLDTWDFGSQHSAEWERKIQETAPFYDELMFRLHIVTP